MISVEWIKNKLGKKIYAVSHAKAVIRNENSTVDDDIAKLEKLLGSTDLKKIGDGTVTGAIKLIADKLKLTETP